MAMLAEQRRKVKYSVDPRGTSWSKDDNKFGQKLMEKMGWSKGKGLGAKLNGNVDHVAVQLKTDSRGVGCSKSYADNWIAHQDDFNSLLANLNKDHSEEGGDNPVDSKVLDLSQKSKTSKGRLHYQKFAKGKDLSLKTENDLDCVFGKRKTNSHQNTPEVSSNESEEEEIEKNDIDIGLKTVTSTDSIQDYFAKKMAERKNRLKGITEGSQDEVIEGETKGVGASFEDDMEKEEYVAESSKCKEKKKKSKKKKKVKENDESMDIVDDRDKQINVKEKWKLGEDEVEGDQLTSIENEGDYGGEVVESKSKKKKKSKKRKLLDEENLGDMNETNTKETGCEAPKKVKKSESVEAEIASEKKDEKSENGNKKKNKKSKKKKKMTNNSDIMTSGQELHSEITVTEHLSEADMKEIETVTETKPKGKKDKVWKVKGRKKHSKPNLQGFKGSNMHEVAGYSGFTT